MENPTSVEELLLNEGFLKWYCQTEEKEIQAWNEWIATSPEHHHLANEAIEMLQLIRSSKDIKIARREISAERNRLKDAIRKMQAGIINS